jgi:DNA-directed RNA polymerase II subunit RPB1
MSSSSKVRTITGSSSGTNPRPVTKKIFKPITGTSSGTSSETKSYQRKSLVLNNPKLRQAISQPEKVFSSRDIEKIIITAGKTITDLKHLRILKSVISIYSYEEMVKNSVVEITNPKLEDNNSGGLSDTRMGTDSNEKQCTHCHRIDCPGHYGIIKFKDPIYNPAFIKDLISILTCVCNECGGLLITKELMEQKGFLKYSYDKRLNELRDWCEGKECLRNITYSDGKKAVCKKNPIYLKDPKDENKGEIKFKDSDERVHIKDIKNVKEILQSISQEDAALLGFNEYSHPKNIIMDAILVPPIIARPPHYEGGRAHHDQITKLFSIIVANKNVREELYIAVRELIFGVKKGKGKGKSNIKDLKSIIQRLQGKEEIPRGYLMGKRVNFCARTVAGPEPNLKFGQIRLPKVWSSVLTKRVKVAGFNKLFLENLLREGKIQHITKKSTGLRKFFNYKTEKNFNLDIGDIVERWLIDGDITPTNRQPTLHRSSLMGYKIVLGKQNTIGNHLSYTTPMNCDFDGDENNVWPPQDHEVEAEVGILLYCKNNILATEQSRPTMGLIYNSSTGSFLLTNYNTILDDDLVNELLRFIKHDEISLNKRLEKYRIPKNSGRAIFSALLPEDFNYRKDDVIISQGILISGRMKSSIVGPVQRSIIHDLYSKYGSKRTARFITEASWVINKWLIERGFSVGISDCINVKMGDDGKLYNVNEKKIQETLNDIELKLRALNTEVVTDPNEEFYRKKQINGIVDVARVVGANLAKGVLSKNNSLGIMTETGAGTKGNNMNIGQMMGIVGQQYFRGERLKATLSGGRRLLPTRDLDDMAPEAHGFVANSFYKGLTPEELFFLQAGGREGLLDTALKTADTGTMQRKMIKAFENIIIAYDGSVRNTNGTLFSPMYNSGYDVAEMMSVKKLGHDKNFYSFVDIQGLVEDINTEKGWVKEDVYSIVEDSKEPRYEFSFDEEFSDEEEDFDAEQPLKITKFEKARIIGSRAQQLANNSPPLIDIAGEVDAVKIAKKEYKLGLIPIYIIRSMPDGTSSKIYPTLENI